MTPSNSNAPSCDFCYVPLQSVPMFQLENLEHNHKLYERVKDMATRKGYTTSQLALAWVHHQGNNVCPIPGTTRIQNLEQNINALDVKLTAEEMVELDEIASLVRGDRYGPEMATWRHEETPPLSSWKVDA
ncbi:UNVERIFIED_CONTAM: putative aldo-keto reductase 2 [Sesamum radiatum]|uniref:Aldo-keto reductase 2 n=1 Tax=Sesamum radiatum TaxID=300843 RepID=A0AAW2UAQ5_SESRA